MEVVNFETFGDLYKAVESGDRIWVSGALLYITEGGFLENKDLHQGGVHSEFRRGFEFTKEPPYSEYIGSLVKVRDGTDDEWLYDILASVDLDRSLPYGVQDNTRWKYMEPLTEAEKNSIITKG